MVSMQIALTEHESQRLREIARETGRTQEELIREGVELLLARFANGDRLALLRQARGIWRDRDDVPSVESLRAEPC